MTTSPGADDLDVLTAALSYAARGWHVFPVSGKYPVEIRAGARLRWSVESTTDPQQIAAWYAGTSGLGIGLDCGKSGLVVVDGDHLDRLRDWVAEHGIGKELVGTARLHGRRDRMSFLFRQPLDAPPVGSPAGFGWGEVKGVGGYIVLPPSPHPDIDEPYEWVDDRPPAVMSARLADALRGTSTAGHGDGPRYADVPEEWLTGDEPCPAVEDVLTEALEALADVDSARQPTMNTAVLELLRLGEQGHDGVRAALELLHGGYEQACSRDHDRARAAAVPGEWARSVRGAVTVITHDGLTDPEDRGCCGGTEIPEPTLLDDTTGEQPPADDPLAELRPEVRRRVRALEAEREARAWMRERDHQPAPPAISLGDFVAAPPPELPWRVGDPVDLGTPSGGGLLPIGGTAVIVGQRKAGKTSLAIELVRCLLTGDAFLGKWPVQKVTGTVFFMDYELGPVTAHRWWSKTGLTEGVYLKLLRGQPNPFSTEHGRADLAAEMRAVGASVVIADPQAVLLQAHRDDENDNAGTRAGLDLFLQTCHAGGVGEVIVLAHAGKDGQKGARGASATEDWPDAVWKLSRDDDGRRIFAAIGRDVDVEPSYVSYDAARRRSVIVDIGNATESNRGGAEAAGYLEEALSYLRGERDVEEGWRSTYNIASALGFGSNSDKRRALVDKLESARRAGLVEHQSKGKAELWRVP